MPTVGGAVKKRKSKTRGHKRKSLTHRKRKTGGAHKRKHSSKSSKYSLMSSDKLRKLISRYNHGKAKDRRLKTTVKVRKGAKVVTRPKKKSALVALCKKHKL